jgi:hypothetical protein
MTLTVRRNTVRRMNDLAERALHGLDVARRSVLARPLPWLVALGFLASALTVLAGARIGAGPAALPINAWLGLLPHAGYRVVGVLPGLVMLTGVTVLVLTWMIVLRLVTLRRVSERGLWTTGAVWSLPFVVGPPLLGTDVFSAVARGLLSRQGLSPYHHGPASVDDEAQLVNAIDPALRGTHTTGGPLSVALEHLFATAAAGNAVAALLLFRALAVVSAIAVGRLAMELAGPRREAALTMTALNPAMLLFVVSGARLEGVLVALLLGAFVAAGQRRWTAAVALTCLAAGLKPVVLVAVVAVIVAHAVGARRHIAWRIAARDLLVAAVVLVACTLVVPYGLGWADNLSSLTREHTPFAPASLVSDLISTVVSAASFDDLAVGGRVAAILAAITVVAYLLVTVRNRPLERTVGYALLAVGLLGPVLYPWYLLWGVLCLAPAARRALRDWVVALSAAACVLAPVGFTERTGEVVTTCCLVVIAAALVPRLVVRHQRTVAALRSAEEVSADASPTGRRGPAPS